MLLQEKIDALLRIECADNVKNLIKEAIKGWEKSEPCDGIFGIYINIDKIWILEDNNRRTCLIGAALIGKISNTQNQFTDAEKYFNISFF